MCSQREEMIVTKIKQMWEQTFKGNDGHNKWQAMSDNEQRSWFESAASSLEDDSDVIGASSFIDVEAEWAAISAGTHAPTDVAGYRILVESAMADDRPDLALNFAKHLLNHSGYAPSVPTDMWNVLLYQLDGKDARQFLNLLRASSTVKVDAHSFTAVISKLGEADMLDGAFEMLDEMRIAGHEPNSMTYNELILDAGNAGDLSRATKALEEMEAAGMWPLLEVYEMLAALADSLGDTDAAHRYTMRSDEIRRAKQKAEPYIEDEFGLSSK